MLNHYRKAIAAVVGAAATAVSLGLLGDPWDKWLAVVVAFVTAAGVYAVPNAGAAVGPGPAGANKEA